MKEPIFIRSLADAERAALRSGLRSGRATPSRVFLGRRRLSLKGVPVTRKESERTQGRWQI